MHIYGDIAEKSYYSMKPSALRAYVYRHKIRTRKTMQYNPEDGHRIKEEQTSTVNWIHSILKNQQILPEEWQLSQCLFEEPKCFVCF